MVSLGDESRRSGGHFFTTEPQSDADTDDLLQDPGTVGSMHKGVPVRFHTIKTVWTTPALLILLICLEVGVFILPDCLHHKVHSHYSLLLYAHVFIWCIFFIADRFARWQHHLSRKQGYLEFYRQTCNLRRLPFFIVSFGNAVLLIVSTLVNDYCQTDQHGSQNSTSGLSDQLTVTSPPHSPSPRCLGLHLDRDNFLQIVFSLEVAVLLVLLLLYLVKVVLFNRRVGVPDVLDQDNSTTSILQSHSSPAEIGFSEEPCMEELIEKQADMIRYLKEHNSALGRRVMELTALRTS